MRVAASPDTWQIRPRRYQLAMQSHRTLGIAVLELRKAIGWTQKELGARADLSQSEVSRVEHGLLVDLSLERAEQILSAMGARLVLSVDAPFLGDRERQRDPAHARCSAHVASRLRRAGWEVETEVEIGGDRSRGWIDILAFHRESGLLLVIEIKTEIRDLGAIERSLNWYERESMGASRRLGWQPRRRVGCLLLLATDANEARAAANREPLFVGFPGRARDLAAVITGTTWSGAWSRAIAMIDPLSRRASWLRPLRVDGRRSPAPFADYADFMRVAGEARSGRR